MPYLFATTSGNFTDNIWESISVTGSQINVALTAANSITTSFLASPAFTAPSVTVTGIWLLVGIRNVSVTGTFSVDLFNSTTSTVAGTVVTNNSDMPFSNNGVYFRFTSPIPLVSGNSYTVRLRSSVANQMSFWYSGAVTNWMRALTISATATPAATDQLFINGQHTGIGSSTTTTVIYNQNSLIEYGAVQVGNLATLDFVTNQTTSLRLSGEVFTGSLTSLWLTGGTFQMGTTSSRIQPGFTASLFITPGSAGGRRININQNSIFRAAGTTMSYTWTTLAADVAAGATTCTTSDVTGWNVGDEIVIAPTRRPANTGSTVQYDRRILTSVSGTTLGFSALSFLHDGTGDFAGEIINLTRNCQIVVTTPSTFRTFIGKGSVSGNDISTLEVDAVQFVGMGTAAGASSGAIALGGFQPTGMTIIRNCSFVDGSNAITPISTNNFYNFIVENNVFTTRTTTGSFYFHSAVLITATPIVVNSYVSNNCMIFGGTSSAVFGIDSVSSAMSFTNNRISGVQTQIGARIGLNTFYQRAVGEISNNIVRCCGNGFLISSNDGINAGLIHNNNKSIRNVSYGFYLVGCVNTRFDNMLAIGNSVAGLLIGFNAVSQQQEIIINGSTFSSDSLSSQPSGVIMGLGASPTSPTYTSLTFNNCNFGTPSVHTTGDIRLNADVNQACDFVLNNCNFFSPIEVSQPSFMSAKSKISIQRANNTNGSHRTYYRFGLLSLDSVIFRSSNRSTRFTPTSSTILQLFSKKVIPVRANYQPTISVYVRKSTSSDGSEYNGTQPILILKNNPAFANFGNYDDIILATASSANGTWEQLSATLPVVPYDDSAFEVYLACSGTVGWVNIDDWKITQ